MLPSSTVENYLKAIYQGQSTAGADARLVSMGSVAAALSVTPGTATTMVKALAESGLAEYEPYSGVRLTAAGEKLAGLVLRRHRLVELFLVQVMGMSWAEVHDEAEHLEHVVSERLIERIDEMLGRPTHDPHGDPIPNPEGTIASRPLDSLLTCPVGTPLRVSRVADQDPAFLRFIENNDLKPGQPIEVEARDAAVDAVQLRGKDRRPITIGARAASKLLVELALTCVLFAGWPGRLAAQTPAFDPHAVQPQRPTVATHAGTMAAGWLEIEAGPEFDRYDEGSSGAVAPVLLKVGLAPRLQLELQAPIVHPPDGHTTGIGDFSVGVKWRVLEDSAMLGDFAILPSVKLATGSEDSGTGTGTTDVGLLLISSHKLGPVAMDLNAGYTRRSGDGTTVPQSASLWAASFGGPALGRLGWVAEVFGYPATDGPVGAESAVAFLAGPTLAVRSWLALDVGVILPITGPQPRAIYGGAVYNAGRLWPARP